jgi:hypothetical protein
MVEALCSGHFTPKERGPTTQRVRIWVDPRACLDNTEKRKFWTLQGLELQPFGHPACSQSLSQLLTGTYYLIYHVNKIWRWKFLFNIAVY